MTTSPLLRAALLGPLLACGCSPAAPEPAAQDQLSIPPFTVLGRLEHPREVRYLIDARGAPLDSADFEQAVERALSIWAETGCVAFAPAELSDSDAEFELVLRWDDGSNRAQSPFGRDTSVAVTRGAATDACEVVFDAARPWTLEDEGDAQRASLFQTAVHELGHAIGLGHTEDARAVLNPQRERGRTVLGPADLAGIHSLYGGGKPGSGDLVLSDAAGRPLGTALLRVAPPGRTEWAVFDTDGDGDDELLVWELEDQGGALTAYHFEPGPRGPLLSKTVGPTLGVAGHGASLHPQRAPDGSRFVDVRWPDGSAVRRPFDDAGLPQPGQALQPPRDPAPAPPELRRTGDLDGDDSLETVTLLG